MIRTIIIERWTLIRRWIPTDVYFWIKALLLAGIAIQLARLIWVVVTPVGPVGEWRPAAARLLPPQAQAAVIASVDPFFRADPAVQAMPSLDLELFGTREDQTAAGGSAIIGPPDGEQRSYLVGEEVAPGIKLAAVYFDHVVLDRGAGREEKLFMEHPESSAPAPVAAGSAPPGDTQPTKQLAVASIQQAVNFAPRIQEGRVTGVVVSPRGDPAAFASAGFRPGDIVVAVNGARITSQTDVVQLQSSIRPGARLSLTVERGAEAVPIALNLAGN